MKRKDTILIIVIGVILILGVVSYKQKPLNPEKEEIKINYSDYYFDTVKTLKEKSIYIKEENFINIGTVSDNIVLNLEKDDYFDLGYFKIKDMDFYIDYKDISESEEEIIDDSWKKYIPFNLSIKTSSVTNLYLNDKVIFSLNQPLTLPIIIKDDNYYGVSFKDKLYYLKKDEVEVIDNVNTDLEYTSAIATLVYHATYDSSNQAEKNKCINNNATICLSDIQFDSQMKYLYDNNFYTATMKDVDMFIDGKIQLPKKTVVITIDDGYFLEAAVRVLEKYNLHATVFVIGALMDLDEWKSDAFYSPNVELHSHTYLMHTPNVCSGGQGSALKCHNREELLADLKKSREQLNGSTVFCYPFFEYNDYAISVLKEAGFTMAFAGGRQKIKVGSNKMTLPRYGIINTSSLNDFIKVVN